MKVAHDTEVWYEIQHSVKGSDDWFSSGGKWHSESMRSARANIKALESNNVLTGTFDYRIVKKTLTDEVVS
jgi:hypothetical protein